MRPLLIATVAALAIAAVPRGDDTDFPFGPRLIDIAFTLDAGAVARLTKEPGAEVPAHMRLGGPTRAERTYAIQLKIKGGDGSRRALDEKPAFKVKLDEGQRVAGLEQLTLNNMVQDHTMVHEALGYHFYDSLGIPVPRTGYARVSLNGDSLGLYLNVETVDKAFLKRRFGDDTGVLYEGTYGADFRERDVMKMEHHLGEDPERAELRAAIGAVNTPGDELFYGARPLLDTRTFLTMIAAESLIEDWDSYYHSNNYRIYRIPSAGRWTIIPTGLDQTFVANRTPVFGATGLLFQKCLASERCAHDYESALRDVVDRFERANIAARLEEILGLMGPASDADTRRPYDDERMYGARDRLRAFIARRPGEVRTALRCVTEERAGILGACAGLIVKQSDEACLEVVPDDAEQNAGGVGVAPCTGTMNERWLLRPLQSAYQLSPIEQAGKCVAARSGGSGPRFALAACAGTASQLFDLTQQESEARLVARQNNQEAWFVQRSIFEPAPRPADRARP